MRVAKLAFVGLSALLAARIVSGCSSDQGEPGYDAGTLPDVDQVGDDAAPSGDDTGATQGAGGDGGDAGVIGDDDAGGSSDDGGAVDVSQPEGADASEARSDADASDGGHDVDASDGAASAIDASDAASSEVDAADDATNAADASDAASNESDAADDATSEADASDGSSTGDAGDDAAVDAAPACVSCGFSVTFLGNTAAFTGNLGTQVNLASGTVPDGQTVSIITQTYPEGSVTAGHAHVVWSTDGFATQTDSPMGFSEQTNNNDQWFFVTQPQPANTTVSFYIRAEGCDCTTVKYDNPSGPGTNFTYTQQ